MAVAKCGVRQIYLSAQQEPKAVQKYSSLASSGREVILPRPHFPDTFLINAGPATAERHSPNTASLGRRFPMISRASRQITTTNSAGRHAQTTRKTLAAQSCLRLQGHRRCCKNAHEISTQGSVSGARGGDAPPPTSADRERGGVSRADPREGRRSQQKRHGTLQTATSGDGGE